jgi:hypothetical protein
MDLLDRPALGADPLQAADREHAGHELGIDRGATDAAAVLGHAFAREAEIQQPIDLAQRVVGRDTVLEAEDVEQRLRGCPPSPRRATSRQGHGSGESRHGHSFNR